MDFFLDALIVVFVLVSLVFAWRWLAWAEAAFKDRNPGLGCWHLFWVLVSGFAINSALHHLGWNWLR